MRDRANSCVLFFLAHPLPFTPFCLVCSTLKKGPFELEHALALDNWGYEELCEHLRETVERLGRCNVSAEDESSSNGVVVVATVPNAAAAAGK